MELSDVEENCIVTCLYRDGNCLHYGNFAWIHVCAGNATVCRTVILQCYIFLHGMELSDIGENCIVTCLYRDWNCLNYGNIATLQVCTGTETVCSTETLH